jgi:hypothetical protein
MQRHAAFRTIAGPIDSTGQLRGTVETTGRGYRLYQSRQARSGYVDGRLGTGRARPFVTAAALFKTRAVRVLVTRLSVSSIAIHGELRYSKNRRRDVSPTQGAPVKLHATVVIIELPEGFVEWTLSAPAKTGQGTRPCCKPICTTLGGNLHVKPKVWEIPHYGPEQNERGPLSWETQRTLVRAAAKSDCSSPVAP